MSSEYSWPVELHDYFQTMLYEKKGTIQEFNKLAIKHGYQPLKVKPMPVKTVYMSFIDDPKLDVVIGSSGVKNSKQELAECFRNWDHEQLGRHNVLFGEIKLYDSKTFTQLANLKSSEVEAQSENVKKR